MVHKLPLEAECILSASGAGFAFVDMKLLHSRVEGLLADSLPLYVRVWVGGSLVHSRVEGLLAGKVPQSVKMWGGGGGGGGGGGLVSLNLRVHPGMSSLELILSCTLCARVLTLASWVPAHVGKDALVFGAVAKVVALPYLLALRSVGN